MFPIHGGHFKMRVRNLHCFAALRRGDGASSVLLTADPDVHRGPFIHQPYAELRLTLLFFLRKASFCCGVIRYPTAGFA